MDCICGDCVYEKFTPCPFEKYSENLIYCFLKRVKETENSCKFFAAYHPRISSLTG